MVTGGATAACAGASRAYLDDDLPGRCDALAGQGDRELLLGDAQERARVPQCFGVEDLVWGGRVFGVLGLLGC